MRALPDRTHAMIWKILQPLEVGGVVVIDNAHDVFMSFHAERIGPRQWAISHWYLQNGDVMYDPEVVLWECEGGLFPIIYRQDNLGLYREYAEFESERAKASPWGAFCTDERRQLDLVHFCIEWISNVYEQQELDRPAPSPEPATPSVSA